MKVFTKFYEEHIKVLKGAKEQWVESNSKINSISLAIRQIKSEGDTNITPAIEVLEKELKAEQTRNEKYCNDMYQLKKFLHSMEVEAGEHGVSWNKVFDIFGY